MASIQAFQDHLAQTALAVEGRLESLLGEDARTGGMFRPPRLMAAMRHAVLGGGKRLRPFLTLAAAKACGCAPALALDAACAVELVHCYSLVHDDLPSMDDDDLRRGRPTVHRAFDEATAILAGDALLTLAFEVVAQPMAHPDAGSRAALVLALARASGMAGMVGGQMLDLAAEGRFEGGTPQSLDAKQISRLQAMKTGALINMAVMAGGIVAGAGPGRMAALEAYGTALGAVFQIADDILDIEASSEAMGKATAKDAAKGKATLVQLWGVEAAKARRDALTEEAIATLAAFDAHAGDLRAAARFTATRGN